jgi:hypothetical protein
VNDLTLRICGPDDAAALQRLAERDSAEPLAGAVLAALAGGELVAAIELTSGRVAADPFRPTAETVELLHRRRAQIRRAKGDGPVRPLLARVLGRQQPAAESA